MPLSIDVVSLDMACTLFWEPGCDPKYGVRYVRSALYKVFKLLEAKGYCVEFRGDPYKLYQDLMDELRRAYPYREVWSRYLLFKLLYRLGLAVDSGTLDEVYRFFVSERVRHFTPMHRAELLLGYLHSRGYKLVLTTATTSHDLVLGIIRRYGYDKYIQVVFSTQLVGIPKTRPEFYLELADTLRADPARIVHVGDSLESDILPARMAGLKTIYYGWRTLCRASDPEPCITTLSDLYGLL